MQKPRIVFALSFVCISFFSLSARCFADDVPEDVVNLRIDEGIMILENREYEKFLRDFLLPELVAEYQKAGLKDSPESRSRIGRYWLKMLRLVQGEKVRVSGMGLKASVSYGRVSWSIVVGLVRKDDTWFFGGVGETHRLVGFHGPDGDPRILADMHRRTKLHRGAMSGNLAEVKRCVHLEWNMFAKDMDGKTPLMLAEEAGHTDVAVFLKRRMDKKAIE